MIRRQLTWLSALTAVLLLGCPPMALAAAPRPQRLPGAPLPPGWRVPLDGAVLVLRPFLPPPAGRPWQRGHRGVDLAAPAGAAVRASAAGLVSFAGPLAGRSVVVVVHGVLRSTYEPVQPTVRVGQRVAAGEVIGRLQPLLQHCGRPCLHWGLLRGAVYLDPLPQPRQVRLLPFTADAFAGGPGARVGEWSETEPTSARPAARSTPLTGAGTAVSGPGQEVSGPAIRAAGLATSSGAAAAVHLLFRRRARTRAQAG